MARVEKQITINAPPEKVFGYVADIARHGEWATPGHKLHVEKTSEGPVGQGATFRSVGHQFGKNEDTVRITEYVPNQRVVYESEGKGGLMRHAFQVTASGGGVQLAKSFEPLKPKFPFVLLMPIAMRMEVPKGLAGDLERIKAKLEGS
jgi:uncharacterized protein YndB with AHSA1/START domain